MRIRIRNDQLAPGRALPFDVYDAEGERIWSAGEVIEQADLDGKFGRMLRGVFRDASAGDLRVGDVLNEHLYDRQGVLLLARGRQVTPRHLEQVKQRGVGTGEVASADAEAAAGDGGRAVAQDHAREPGVGDRRGDDDAESSARPPVTLQTPMTRRLDRIIAHGDRETADGSGTGSRAGRLPVDQLNEEVAAVGRVRAETVEHYAELADDLIHGRSVELGKAQSIVEQIVDTARRDPSLCLLNVESPALVDEYIFDHGVNVMMLGICVAEYLGYSERAVHELGVGAMLQDLGMIRVPADVRFAPRKLNPVEWVEVQRHPIHTVDLLEKARNAPARSMLIAYQAHERCDRSGYPRGRTRASILSPARLIACADTFVALTSPRPHRPALKPYDAMVAVLKDAHAGRLDADSVRAMLDCLSLFPVGSYVELSDGRRARVIRGNGSNHTQPVVQPMNDRAEPDGEAIDLSVDASVRVSAAADGSTPDKDAAVIAETAIGLSMGRG